MSDEKKEVMIPDNISTEELKKRFEERIHPVVEDKPQAKKPGRPAKK